MPKLTSRAYYNRDRKFQVKYNVSVDKEGIFSTTLPTDATEFLHENGVSTEKNRLGNYGRFAAESLDQLERKVREAFEEAFSRELIEQKLILLYQIETTCSYSIDENGEYIPNCGYDWTKLEYGTGIGWCSGTTRNADFWHQPYGLQVYVHPVVRQVYKYKSGKTFDDEVTPSRNDWGKLRLKEDYYLRWLCDLTHMHPIKHASTQEIEYEEDVGRFFVDLLKAIFTLNENIKDRLTPESIKQLAQGGVPLLGSRGPDAR